jgi:hypothetical protein
MGRKSRGKRDRRREAVKGVRSVGRDKFGRIEREPFAWMGSARTLVAFGGFSPEGDWEVDLSEEGDSDGQS